MQGQIAKKFEDREYLTLEEAAELALCHRRTIDRLIEQRKLRSYLFVNKRLVRRDELIALIQSQPSDVGRMKKSRRGRYDRSSRRAAAVN